MRFDDKDYKQIGAIYEQIILCEMKAQYADWQGFIMPNGQVISFANRQAETHEDFIVRNKKIFNIDEKQVKQWIKDNPDLKNWKVFYNRYIYENNKAMKVQMEDGRHQFCFEGTEEFINNKLDVIKKLAIEKQASHFYFEILKPDRKDLVISANRPIPIKELLSAHDIVSLYHKSKGADQGGSLTQMFR